MKNLSQETGRSMIEMLGVLAIIGVLSVGGIAGYSMAMSKFKVTKAIDQVQTITTNVRTQLSGQRRWSALKKASDWLELTVLSEETVTGEGDAQKGMNVYGGEIIIDSETNAAKRQFSISYAGVPKDACIKIATSDWGGDVGSGLVSIKVGNTEYKWGDQTNPLPPDLTSALKSCADKNDNTIVWTYK